MIFNPVYEPAAGEPTHEELVAMYYAGKEVRVVSSLSAADDEIVDMSNIAD